MAVSVGCLIYMPKKILFGQVKGRGVVGRPRKIWNDVLWSDTQSLNIRRPYTVAQNKFAWKAKTVNRMHLAYSEGVIFIIVSVLACLLVVCNTLSLAPNMQGYG